MTSKSAFKAINATEHLTSLGWAGPGHSLDSHTSNRGLSKPLLVTHKQNTRGLGSRSAKERQADQWWLNAFDSALRQINAGSEARHTGSSALEKVQQYGMGKGSLYGWFKRGETLGSTFEIDSTISEQSEAQPHRNDSKHPDNQPAEDPMSTRKVRSQRSMSSAPDEEGRGRCSNGGFADSAQPKAVVLDDEEGHTALVKAELKRQRRQGAFEAPLTLLPAARKEYSKKLRKKAKKQIKLLLLQSSLPNQLKDSTEQIQSADIGQQAKEERSSRKKKRKRKDAT